MIALACILAATAVSLVLFAAWVIEQAEELGR